MKSNSILKISEREYGNRVEELYNLKNDPEEENNVIYEFTEKAENLHTKLKKMFKKKIPKVPTGADAYETR